MRWIMPDRERILLDDDIGRLANKFVRPMCNKPSTMYFLQSAPDIGSGSVRMLMGTKLPAAAYKEWIRACGPYPNLDFGHYFANPVRITANGPATLPGVIKAHLSLCKQASNKLQKTKDKDPSVDYLDYPLNINVNQYSMKPLCRAIILVVDHTYYFPNSDDDLLPDGFFHDLDQTSARQTILLVKTGMEDGLKAPISFASLQSETLPLEQSEIIPESLEVIRVSLTTAIQLHR